MTPTSKEKSLAKIVKKGIKKKILNIKFENVETGEALQNLDDLKIGMIISIDFEVELEKNIKIISKYIVVAADKIQLFSARADEQFKEPEEYLKEAFKIAKEIGDVLTKTYQKI
ncbi:MAG: hypothetical protein NWF08_01195 [Candidatus Bathyarchaeota archaeon]|nr:hypothetical protein [Candidatus Bathyarchaeota archaeon]